MTISIKGIKRRQYKKNASDWYSEGTTKTTNNIDQVIPADTVVTEVGLGRDWYSEKDQAADRTRGTLLFMDRTVGIGMDRHSEDTPTPLNARENCLPVGSVAFIAGNC